jgi:hypothetical protein
MLSLGMRVFDRAKILQRVEKNTGMGESEIGSRRVAAPALFLKRFSGQLAGWCRLDSDSSGLVAGRVPTVE